VTIIPTGDEIANGTVVDTNSPRIMELILSRFPQCSITRTTPVRDIEKDIAGELEKYISKVDLIFLLGGTGGGRRFDNSLAYDYSHCAVLSLMPEASYRELYGSNGHLWSKLVVAKKSGTLIITLPGPYVEAEAAAKAVVEDLDAGVDLPETIVTHVAQAVLSQYPKGGKIV